MIVVVIIGVLAAMGIPYYLKSRVQSNAKSCVNNLRIMEDAKVQYIFENRLSNSATVSIDSLSVYLRNPTNAYCPTTADPYLINGASSGPANSPITCPNYNSVSSEFSTHKYP
jgi:type II secretory pathway pseudopilin PulG